MELKRGSSSLRAGSVRRIVVLALAVVMAIGIAVSAVQQRSARGRQEEAAASRARLVTDTVIAPTLTDDDLAGPVTAERYEELAAVVRSRILVEGTVSLTILRRDATVVFATQQDLVGQKLTEEKEALKPVLEGAQQVRISGPAGSSTQIFETLVPLHLKAGGPVVGVVEVSQDYTLILAAASRPWQPLEIGFAAALLLCLIALPIVSRAPKRKPGNEDWLPKASQPSDEASTELQGKLRQALEQARQADAAYRTVSDQLRKGEERIREAEAEQRSAADEVRQAEERSRANEQRFKSAEAALKAARERLGQLEEKLKTAAHAPAADAGAPAGDPALKERLSDTEEQFGKALEQLREGEVVKQSLVDQARQSEERAQAAAAELQVATQRLAELEARVKETEAAKQALAEQAEQAEERGAGAGELIEQLEQRAAESDAERQRLAQQLEQIESSKQALAEQLDAARRRPDLSEELNAAVLRAAQTEEGLRAAEERIREAEQRAQAAEEELRPAQERDSGGQTEELEQRLAASEAAQAQMESELGQQRERLREAEERYELSETAYQSVAEELREMQRHPDLKEQLHAAEERVRAAEERVQAAEEGAARAEQRAVDAERRAPEAPKPTGRSRKAAFTERLRQAQADQADQAQASQADPEERVREIEEQLRASEERVGQAEQRLREMELQLAAAGAGDGTVQANGNGHHPDLAVVIEDQREEREALQAAVANEVRGPLSSILGLTLAMKHQDPSSPEAKDLVRQLTANAKKLDRLVSDLLDIDRLANGTLVPNRRRTDLEALVRRVVDESKDLVDRHVTVETEHAVALLDPGRAEQIVESLLANADRRTVPGGSVWVKVGSDQGGVLITVADDGPEIPKDLRVAILKSLQDGPDSASPKGATGLSLLARLAEIHGGRTWVEERQGGGASFRVFLPDAPVEVSGVVQEERGAAAPASTT